MFSGRAIHPAFLAITLGTACTLLTAGGCSKSDDAKDKRIAELEQQLKTQGAPAAQPAAPAASEQTPAAPAPAAGGGQRADAAKPAAGAAPAAKAPAGVSAEQYGKDKATVKDFAAQQRDVNAKQAATNAQVQGQIQDLKPIEVTLPAGTIIAARNSADLSTDKLKDGSTFEALLEQDLVVDNVLVAKKGAHVTGVVVSSSKGGRVKGVASLEVTARAIEGLKGSTIRIHADNFSTKADTSKGKDAARTGIMAGAGAAIGAIAGGGKGAAIGAAAGGAAGVTTNLATHGKAAVIPAETLIEFHLTSPTTVVVPR